MRISWYDELTRIDLSEYKAAPLPKFPKTSGWSNYSYFPDPSRKTETDLRLSSLVMAGTGWLGKCLSEASLTVQQPTDGNESEPIPNHPLVEKFKRPNRYNKNTEAGMSGSTLWKAFAYSWILDGNVYFVKWRNAPGQVNEIWYEPHWLICPRWKGDNLGAYIQGSNDDPNAFINYYEVDRDGRKYRVEVDDVVHFRDGIDPMPPSNGRKGLSRLKTILREILNDNQLADYAANLLGSGGIPPYGVSLDKDLQVDQEVVDKVKDRLKRLKPGEPAVVWGASFDRLGYSLQELDVRVSRYLGEERFAAVTGIPLEVMHLGAGNENKIYNNVSEARRDAAQSYLVPLWWYIAEELTAQLLPDFDTGDAHFVEHDTSEVQALQESEDSLHARTGLDYQNGIITRGEARTKLNHPVDEKRDNVFFVRSGSSIVPAEAPPDEPQTPVDQDLDLANVPTNGGKELPA